MGTPSQSYVDPAIAANSGTGTIGDPYGDLQYALNTQTRDSTNGDQFNIKAGTDEILAAALTLATYGTPTLAAPLIFRGYTSAADDGGIGGISGNGSLAMFASTYAQIYLIDLHLHNSGSATILTIGTGHVIHCEIENTTGGGVVLGANAVMVGCYLHDIGAVGVSGGILVEGNFLGNGASKKFATAIGDCPYVFNNIIKLDGSSGGISANLSNGAWFQNNTVWSNGGTGVGINGGTSNTRFVRFLNNIVEGFSGTGGVGYRSQGNLIVVYGYNKFYNNATNESFSTNVTFDLGGNAALSASPFVNPSGDDFRIKAISGIKAGAFPATFYGSQTNQYMDIGAAQRMEFTARTRSLMGI